MLDNRLGLTEALAVTIDDATTAPDRAPKSALTDDEVVVRVLEGQMELFEILMRRYNQRLYRVARGFVSDPTEAEDIAQEAFVSAFHKLAGFRGEAQFSTWLTRIAIHEALARVKERRRFVPLADDAERGSATDRPGPERRAQNRELGTLLSDAVESLPDLLRPVFVLREIEGLSSDETAEGLGISSANVRVRLHRAKALLRDRIDEQMGQEARQLFLFAGPRCDRLVKAVFARLAIGGQARGKAIWTS